MKELPRITFIISIIASVLAAAGIVFGAIGMARSKYS
jgi:hypothetical protein